MSLEEFTKKIRSSIFMLGPFELGKKHATVFEGLNTRPSGLKINWTQDTGKIRVDQY